jgi:hypothetical protein
MAKDSNNKMKRVLFTGPNKVKFKTGDEMLKVIRSLAKEHGKANITLISGGNQGNAIDQSIKKLGAYTGIKVEEQKLDFKNKDASGIRQQQRTNDPQLTQYSFNNAGKLSLKDKHADGWRSQYQLLGLLPQIKGDARYNGKRDNYATLKFPQNKYVKDAEGNDTDKLLSSSTTENSKFKTLLDIIEDEKNPQKQESGVRYAKNLDAWTKENRGFNLINEHNSERLDYLEFGEGIPSGAKEYKTYDDFETKTYLDFDRDELNQSGKGAVTRIKANTTSPFSGKDISGKSLSKTMKVKSVGTILTGHKKKDPPSNVSPKYLDAPDKTLKEGPITYSKSSSLKQFENIEHAEPNKGKDAKALVLKDGMPKEEVIDGMNRNKKSFGTAVNEELKKDMTNLESHIKNAKGKSLITSVPDVLAKSDMVINEDGSVQSGVKSQTARTENVPKPANYRLTKQGSTEKTLAKVSKGPHGGIEKQNTGRVTAKARHQSVNNPKPSLRITKEHVQKYKNATTDIISKKTNTLPIQNQKDSIAKANKKGPTLSLDQHFAKRVKNLPALTSTQKAGKVKRITVTKPVTTSVTASLKKIPATERPTKKVVTGYPAFKAGKVSTAVKAIVEQNNGQPNIEYKHRNQKTIGKGTKFTRGIGAFNLLSSILTPIVGRQKAKAYTGKKDPSVMDAFKMTYPKILGLPRKKGQTHWSDPS